MASPAPFTFDRSWDFDVSPQRLWAVLEETPAYPRWWPWLRSFEPVALEVGARTRGTIGPPLPYVLAVDLHVIDVVPESLVEVNVSGDVAGPARLEIAPRAAGSTARLVWTLDV